MIRTTLSAGALALLACAAPASADVVISSDPTSNMSCSAGVCAPTATDAVLNVTDLENLLASGNVSVVTTNGSVQANNIDVAAAFSWSTTSGLTLDAYQSIAFSAIVQNLSTGDVSLITDDGGTGGILTFAIGSGRLDTNAVSINGEAYKMAKNVKDLAAEVLAKLKGHFALSKSTDAGKDGVYYNPPIPLGFSGKFNGLGHSISNLEIIATGSYAGLFAEVKSKATIASLTLKNVVIRAPHGSSGALVSVNYGAISNIFVSGSVHGGTAGGLIGDNEGNVNTSQSAVAVRSKDIAGGLVGANFGIIRLSFARGKVLGSRVGGLMGFQNSIGGNVVVENCYAVNNVGGNRHGSSVGGFAGYINAGSISTSYSTGAVSGRKIAHVGGFDGDDMATITDSYWDTDTSGTDQGSGDGNETGLTGLTTAQLQSGLPAGFDPAIWAEDASINNGFPYLIANPPAQ